MIDQAISEKEKNSDFIELRSEEIQDLMIKPPKWLIRWGITVMLLILILIFTGAWMIHYPDIIRAGFKITSNNAPKVLLARSEGRLVRILVQDGQTVKAGSELAYLESTARHDEVLLLIRELTNAWKRISQLPSETWTIETLNKFKLSGYSQLGELQNDYQVFEHVHVQLRAYLINGFYSKKKELLRKEITDLQELAQNIYIQQQILVRDTVLAREDFAIQQQLARDKDISLLELKREESKINARRLPYQQIASTLINNLTAQRAKQKEILELDKQVTEERDKFTQTLNTLRSEADSWKLKYVLIAPVTGRISFQGFLQENQFVSLNQELLYVIPPNTSYLGELHIPQQNAGKVRVGQKVLVKFTGYPYQEFGGVKGQITSIADIPSKDSVFLARVVLPEGLKTTYNKQLVYKNGMSASAEIITDDTRLLQKLFYQLRKLKNGW